MKLVIKALRNNFGYLIPAFILGVSWIPYLACTYYVLPCSDDFGTANSMTALGGHSIKNVFLNVRQVYFNWLGTYSGKTFSAFFDPLGRMGTEGNRVFLCVLSVLFVLLTGTLFFMFFSFYMGARKQHIFLLVSLCTAMCLNCRVLTQILFWFTGGAEYTLPVLFGFGGIITQISLFRERKGSRKKIFVFSGSFLGIIACGGNLQVAGFVCFVFLVFLCYSVWKRTNIYAHAISFTVVFMGALMNAAAPGNYVRKGVIESNISMTRAIFYAMIAVLEEIKYIFSSSYIPWMLLCLLILNLFFLPVICEKLYHPMLVGVIVLCVWLISSFPVCYGYGSSLLMDRGKELLDVFIVIGLCFWVSCCANWLKQKNIILRKESLLVIILLALVHTGYQQSEMPISQMPSVVCFLQLASGDLKEYHDEWKDALEQIEESNMDTVEVAVRKSVYETKSIVRSPGLTEEFEDWHNTAVATFYGKEKVRVIIQDAEESE